VYGFAAGDPITYSDPYGLAPEEEDCPKCEIKTSTIHTSGSTTTVVNEHAPLTQEHVNSAINEKRRRERTNDSFSSAIIGLIAARLGVPPPAAAVGGYVIGASGSDSQWQYMPQVGDQVTTSVSATPFASTSHQSYVVRRADGTTFRLNGSPWDP
jgi:hypothetical protein